MPIDWTKPIQTTSGLTAEYIRPVQGVNDIYHLVWVNNSTRYCDILFDEEGRARQDYHYTIINIPEFKHKGEIWVACCQSQSGAVFQTLLNEYEAKAFKLYNTSVKKIALIRVPWTEGDGL